MLHVAREGEAQIVGRDIADFEFLALAARALDGGDADALNELGASLPIIGERADEMIVEECELYARLIEGGIRKARNRS